MRSALAFLAPVDDGASDGLAIGVARSRTPSGIELLSIRPQGETRPLPLVLHFHPGGFVMGHPNQSLFHLRKLAYELGAMVVSVAYRLAPEHPYPAPLTDAVESVEHLLAYAAAYGIDRSRVLLAGESAGANLALALALQLKDREALGGVRGLSLMGPMLDDRTALVREDRVAWLPWRPAENAFAWACYLNAEPGGRDTPERAAPGRAKALHGLPSVWLGVGAEDLFHGECARLAAGLAEAEVPVELREYPGAYHYFEAQPGPALSKRARADRLRAMARALA